MRDKRTARTLSGLMFVVARWAVVFGVIAAGIKNPSIGMPFLVFVGGFLVFLRVVYIGFKNPFR